MTPQTASHPMHRRIELSVRGEPPMTPPVRAELPVTRHSQPSGLSQARQQRKKNEFPTRLPYTTYRPSGFGKTLKIAFSPTKVLIQQGYSGIVDHRIDVTSLRDKCNCSKCRDPSSSQKTFRSTEIPKTLAISKLDVVTEGLHITLCNDIPRLADETGCHTVTVPWSSIRDLWGADHETTEASRPTTMLRGKMRTGVTHWDQGVLTDRVRSIDYETYIEGGEGMWNAVVDLCRYGIVFLRNVPQDQDSIKRITNAIAPIQNTFYGETFDVRAKPNAENVAYTSDYLGLHQDLLYLVSPPQIQILHCMENSCAGGESLFSDGDRIGRLLSMFRSESDAIFALSQRPIDFGYEANGFSYHRTRKAVLHLNKQGNFNTLWWSPPFESPHGGRNLTRPAIRGQKILETLLNAKDAVYERKMEPGECVLFDNRRVMHGRNAFDAAGGGSRWLRGAYISEEDFKSKIASMPERYAEQTREGGMVNLSTPLPLQALRHTPWYAQVKELIDQDIEEADADFEARTVKW